MDNLWGGNYQDIMYDGDGSRASEEAFERLHQSNKPQPKAICTNCLLPVDYSRVDGRYWAFNANTTEPHACTAGKDVHR